MKHVVSISVLILALIFLFHTPSLNSAERGGQSQPAAQNAAQTPPQPAVHPAVRYKFFLSPFTIKARDNQRDFFKNALPRSIRTTLRLEHQADFEEQAKSRSALTDAGYDFVITGMIVIKEDKLVLEFFVSRLKTNKVLIFADATGFADQRIFDLVDNMTKHINHILKKPLALIESSPSIVSINERGEVSQKSLKGADLSNRNLSGLQLSELDIEGINLSGSNLEGVNFTGSNLTRANFFGAQAGSVNFSRSNLSFSNFRGADLRNAVFNFSTLHNADFTDAILSNQSDVNIGLIGGSGAFGWFTTEGRIYKGFYVGARIGFSAYTPEGETEKLKNLPVFITANYYILDKSALERHLFRPFITFGLGYRFALSDKSDKGFIALTLAGVEFCLHSDFSLLAETGFVFVGKFVTWTIGAGLKVYMPDVYKKRQVVTAAASTGQPDNSYRFLGVKLGMGLSGLVQKADENVNEDIKYKPFVPYQAGIRYMYFPKGKIGFIVDLDFTSLAAKQNTDVVSGVTRIYYLSLDPMFGLKFSSFFAGIGLSLGIPVGAYFSQTAPVERATKVYDLFKKINFGVKAAFGYIMDFNAFKLFVGLDARFGFTNIYKISEFVPVADGYKVPLNWSIMVNVGLGI